MVEEIRITTLSIRSQTIIEIIDHQFIESQAQQYGNVETELPTQLPSQMILLFYTLHFGRIFWVGRRGEGWGVVVDFYKKQCVGGVGR